MLQRNFKEARQLLTNSKQMNLSAKLNDQWQLTNLLLTVNEAEKIDAVFEQQILSSVQWLAQKLWPINKMVMYGTAHLRNGKHFIAIL